MTPTPRSERSTTGSPGASIPAQEASTRVKRRLATGGTASVLPATRVRVRRLVTGPTATSSASMHSTLTWSSSRVPSAGSSSGSSRDTCSRPPSWSAGTSAEAGAPTAALSGPVMWLPQPICERATVVSADPVSTRTQYTHLAAAAGAQIGPRCCIVVTTISAGPARRSWAEPPPGGAVRWLDQQYLGLDELDGVSEDLPRGLDGFGRVALQQRTQRCR